jgi:hypothetical protein
MVFDTRLGVTEYLKVEQTKSTDLKNPAAIQELSSGLKNARQSIPGA